MSKKGGQTGQSRDKPRQQQRKRARNMAKLGQHKGVLLTAQAPRPTARAQPMSAPKGVLLTYAKMVGNIGKTILSRRRSQMSKKGGQPGQNRDKPRQKQPTSGHTRGKRRHTQPEG